MMDETYSKQNILVNFARTQGNIERNHKEHYSMTDLYYGFNKLSTEEQDLFLKIKKSKQDLSELQEIIEKIRVEAKKCKSSHLVGVKLIIKNPTYKYEMKRIIESKKSNGNKKKNSTSEEAKSLLRYGFMTKEEVLDDKFGYDEKQIIDMKYSEEPPLNSTAVAIKLCIGQEEVDEATIKFYKEVISKYKAKTLKLGDSNGK